MQMEGKKGEDVETRLSRQLEESYEQEIVIANKKKGSAQKYIFFEQSPT